MTDRELLEQALEALEETSGGYSQNLTAAMRERLAQPQRTHWEGCEEVHPECRKQEQEQEAKMLLIDEDTAELVLEALENVTKDYVENRKRTHDRAIEQLYKVFTQKPQRREWVGLTDDDIALICGECAASAHRTDDISYARAIEAKLREKNT